METICISEILSYANPKHYWARRRIARGHLPSPVKARKIAVFRHVTVGKFTVTGVSILQRNTVAAAASPLNTQNTH